MFDELSKYKTNGEFIFRVGDKLSDFCKSVPHAAGVYVFRTIKNRKEKVVYIGASGTMKQNGTFLKQLMKKRLQNMQGKIRRQTHFESEIAKNNLEGVRVNWYITFDKQHQDLPMTVEGFLIQKYFDENKHLPEWNKKY